MRLAVLFVRPSTGTTMHRALASLEGAAEEAIKMTGVPYDVEAFITACRMLSIRDIVSGATKDIAGDELTYLTDLPSFFGSMIPVNLCHGGRLPANFSHAVNVAMSNDVTSDYILLMSPSEVCLDPLNIERTMDYLDTKPQISVVSCPTKIYEAGEHVRTVMMPKLIRRGSVNMTGLLADNWFPCNDQNWLINASGLEFMDHGDAEPNQALVDTKICINDYLNVRAINKEGPSREDLVALGERLIPWNPTEALHRLAQSTKHYVPQSTESVRMVVAAARVNLVSHNYEYAIEHATNAIAILPSAAAYLIRGFARCGIESGWEDDLRKAVELSQAITSYGLDMRELNLAKMMVRWLDEPTKRCLSNHDAGLDIPCLVTPGHDGKHIGIRQGLRVGWESEDFCLDCGAPINGGHGDCQNT